MKTRIVTLLAIGALGLAPAALAAGSLAVSPASVTAGSPLEVNACVATAGDGGYLVIKGPNATTRISTFGPATPCSTFQLATTGWAAGKYRITGFEETAKGSKGIGSATVTVT